MEHWSACVGGPCAGFMDHKQYTLSCILNRKFPAPTWLLVCDRPVFLFFFWWTKAESLLTISSAAELPTQHLEKFDYNFYIKVFLCWVFLFSAAGWTENFAPLMMFQLEALNLYNQGQTDRENEWGERERICRPDKVAKWGSRQWILPKKAKCAGVSWSPGILVILRANVGGGIYMASTWKRW